MRCPVGDRNCPISETALSKVQPECLRETVPIPVLGLSVWTLLSRGACLEPLLLFEVINLGDGDEGHDGEA
jgi:hypothetical protein